MLSSPVVPAAMANPVYREEGPMDLVSRQRIPSSSSDSENIHWPTAQQKPAQIPQVPTYYHYGYYPLVERLPYPVPNIPYPQGYVNYPVKETLKRIHPESDQQRRVHPTEIEAVKRLHPPEVEQKVKRRPPDLNLKKQEESNVFLKPEPSPRQFWRPDSPLMTSKGQLPRPPTKSPPEPQKDEKPNTVAASDNRTIQMSVGKPVNQLRGTFGQPLAPFRRGSLVRLANNSLRRVEDLNVDDFIQSAEQTPGIRIERSTVQFLNENVDGTLTITFLTQGSNKVTHATSPDQPFFVVNRGWCSYNPLRTLELYGLSCSRLQTNDVCIALSQTQSSGADAPSSGEARR